MLCPSAGSGDPLVWREGKGRGRLLMTRRVTREQRRLSGHRAHIQRLRGEHCTAVLTLACLCSRSLFSSLPVCCAAVLLLAAALLLRLGLPLLSPHCAARCIAVQSRGWKKTEGASLSVLCFSALLCSVRQRSAVLLLWQRGAASGGRDGGRAAMSECRTVKHSEGGGLGTQRGD